MGCFKLLNLSQHDNMSSPLPTCLRRFLVFGGAVQWLARRPWGRRLLLAVPRLFSFGIVARDGVPSEEQMKDAVFLMTNIGHGYSTGGEGHWSNQRSNFVSWHLLAALGLREWGGDTRSGQGHLDWGTALLLEQNIRLVQAGMPSVIGDRQPFPMTVLAAFR
jgi:hypothetical protein